MCPVARLTTARPTDGEARPAISSRSRTAGARETKAAAGRGGVAADAAPGMQERRRPPTGEAAGDLNHSRRPPE
ncbi:MAG: hypothetical protein HZC41_21995 [Chloroflexi bacterium]|nr:hypothetical protein [Chloroflexota bacterium]